MFLLVIWVRSPSNRLLAILVKAHIYHNASMGQYCKVASIYYMLISTLCHRVYCFFYSCSYQTKGRKSLGQRSREKEISTIFLLFLVLHVQVLIKKKEDVENLSIIHIIRDSITKYSGYLFLGWDDFIIQRP